MKEASRKLKNQSGLTLVEILISMFILSIIITSFSGALVYATRVSKDNRVKTAAVNLANEEIEKIRAMKFLDVGNKNGDPSGEIPTKKEVSVDGITYIINTLINWEEQGEWTATGNMDWDYKSVRVTVTPKGMDSNPNLTKRIETYVTRDSTQPALIGGNLRVGVVRGWKSDPDKEIPVSTSQINLYKDSVASRIVFTSPEGVARFLGLANGNYKVTVDPSSQGMIINPSQVSGWDVNIKGTVTLTKIFEAEFPCYINLTMKTIEGDPFDLDSSEKGIITLQVPYGSDIVKNFNHADVDSEGNLPKAFISDLWPVGDGYAGQYNISTVEIPGKYYLGSYEKNGQKETEWTGKFDGPGTNKNITCYFYQYPDTPSGTDTDLVTKKGSNYNIDSGIHVKSSGSGTILDVSVSTGNTSQTINMPTSSSSDITAAAIYFDNTGSGKNSGLLINTGSRLTLRTGMAVFRGEVSFSGTGTITLRAEYDGDTTYSPINGSSIGGTPGESYGKLFLEKPMVVNGKSILDKGGYYFRDDIQLPGAVVNNTDIIPFTKDNYIE